MTDRVPAEEDARKEIVRAAFEDWATGRGGPFTLLADDAQWTIVGNSPVSRTYTSRQDFLDVVIGPFNARMSEPLVPTVRGLYADGDWVVALFDAAATARDGRPYRNTYTWYLRLVDGAIVEAVAFFDTIEFTDLWTRVAPEGGPPRDPGSPFASFRGHHVGVRVPDYEAAKAWYTGKLDFRVVTEWPYGDLRLAYLSPPDDDDFHLELLAGPVPHPAPVLDDLGESLDHGGYQHFCLHVASVDAAREELRSRGVDLVGEPFEIPEIGRRLAFLRDPWGNMIELSQIR